MSFRNVSHAVLVVLAIVPWFIPARASHHASHLSPRVTLRMVDARLDRIEAELMAILRHVGGKEDEHFPLPPWLGRGMKERGVVAY